MDSKVGAIILRALAIFKVVAPILLVLTILFAAYRCSQ